MTLNDEEEEEEEVVVGDDDGYYYLLGSWGVYLKMEILIHAVT